MSPITGLGDDDDVVGFYGDMGIISDDQYRKIKNEKFVDYYKSLDKDKQQKSKIALSYCLSKPDSDFERIF